MILIGARTTERSREFIQSLKGNYVFLNNLGLIVLAVVPIHALLQFEIWVIIYMFTFVFTFKFDLITCFNMDCSLKLYLLFCIVGWKLPGTTVVATGTGTIKLDTTMQSNARAPRISSVKHYFYLNPVWDSLNKILKSTLRQNYCT